MVQLPRRLAKLSLLCAATSLPILVMDIYLIHSRIPEISGRILLLSGGGISTSSNKVRHYTPNSNIRVSAIYGDTIEYDYTFKTDEFGFRKTHSCQNPGRDGMKIAIAGDSFTEGLGSSISWVQQLEKMICLRGTSTINTAMAGYGIEDMNHSLAFTRNSLNTRKAIIGLIQDDIWRLHVPMISSSECSVYNHKDYKCGETVTWWHVASDMSRKGRLRFARTKQFYGVVPLFKVSSLLVVENIRNLVRKVLVFSGLAEKLLMKITLTQDVVFRSASAMDMIIQSYGVENVLIFLLPTKNDLGLEGTATQRLLRNQGFKLFRRSLSTSPKIIDIRDCPLSSSHFHVADGHPNTTGQALLGKCAVSKLLQNASILHFR